MITLKRVLPRSLFGRWLVLLVAPVVVLQALLTYVFYERHWDAVTRRLGLGLAGEIAVVISTREGNSDPVVLADLIQRMGQSLEIDISFHPGEDFPANIPQPRRYSILDRMLIQALSERLPAIEPDITVDTAHNLREQFRQRRFDLLIQNDDMPEAAGDGETAIAPLCRFPMRWIARPAMLPNDRDLEIEDLERVPLLTFSRTSGPRAHVRALFAGRSTEPRVCSFPSVQSTIQLTKGGFGVAAIPPIFVRDELGAGYLEERGGPALPPMTITVAHLRDTAPAAQAVARLTRAVVGEYCVEAGESWVVNLAG